MKKKICNFPGCNKLIGISERYCSQHKREAATPFSSAVRYNEALYNTTQWRRLRKEILKECPNCYRCGADTDLQVHHIIPPKGNEDLFFDRSNLATICSSCHRIENKQRDT
jgi:5-methylcytosine-specific restriction endonuclease McrA